MLLILQRGVHYSSSRIPLDTFIVCAIRVRDQPLFWDTSRVYVAIGQGSGYGNQSKIEVQYDTYVFYIRSSSVRSFVSSKSQN